MTMGRTRAVPVRLPKSPLNHRVCSCVAVDMGVCRMCYGSYPAASPSLPYPLPPFPSLFFFCYWQRLTRPTCMTSRWVSSARPRRCRMGRASSLPTSADRCPTTSTSISPTRTTLASTSAQLARCLLLCWRCDGGGGGAFCFFFLVWVVVVGCCCGLLLWVVVVGVVVVVVVVVIVDHDDDGMTLWVVDHDDGVVVVVVVVVEPPFHPPPACLPTSLDELLSLSPPTETLTKASKIFDYSLHEVRLRRGREGWV